MSVIINIKQFGDFDMPMSVKLMKAPDVYTKSTASGLARRVENQFADTNDIDAVVAELKRSGFVEVTNIDLTVGRNI